MTQNQANFSPKTRTRDSRDDLKALNTILVIMSIIICKLSPAQAHIIMTRDDRGGNLLLTDEDGGGGGGGQGENVVIANDGQSGNSGGGGGGLMGGGGNGGSNSNFILQDADNREGDVVMNGKNIIIPGEDGHIVMADSRNQANNQQQQFPPNNFALWLPFLGNRMGMNYPTSFYGGFGGFGNYGGFNGMQFG